MKKYTLQGFTLLEVAIVLLIIGIIGAGVFKGQDLIESARIRAVAQDFEKYRLAFIHYQETYQSLPGDDPQATQRFGADVAQGNGNQVIDPDEVDLAWLHLNKGGFVNSATPPSGRMNGVYHFKHQPSGMSGHWLELSDGNGKGVLTPKQAMAIKSKLDEGQSKPQEGALRIVNDSSGTNCVADGGSVNLASSAKSCLIYYQLS